MYASTAYNLVIVGHRPYYTHRVQDTTRIKHDHYITFYIFLPFEYIFVRRPGTV